MQLLFLFCFIATTLAYGGGGGGGGKKGKGKGGKKGGGGGEKTIKLAVNSKHVFKLMPVASSSDDAELPTLVVESGSKPLKLQMGSSSSDVEIETNHQNSKPQVKSSSSVDGALILKHYVRKPVHQFVYEKIIPQRSVHQHVMPVKEMIKTIVAQEKEDNGDGDTTTAANEYGGDDDQPMSMYE